MRPSLSRVTPAAKWARLKRANETPAERSARLERQRQISAQRFLEEPEEQKRYRARLQYKREQKRKNRIKYESSSKICPSSSTDKASPQVGHGSLPVSGRSYSPNTYRKICQKFIDVEMKNEYQLENLKQIKMENGVDVEVTSESNLDAQMQIKKKNEVDEEVTNLGRLTRDAKRVCIARLERQRQISVQRSLEEENKQCRARSKHKKEQKRKNRKNTESSSTICPSSSTHIPSPLVGGYTLRPNSTYNYTEMKRPNYTNIKTYQRKRKVFIDVEIKNEYQQEDVKQIKMENEVDVEVRNENKFDDQIRIKTEIEVELDFTNEHKLDEAIQIKKENEVDEEVTNEKLDEAIKIKIENEVDEEEVANNPFLYCRDPLA